MEAAITSGFLKNVQAATQRYVREVELESQQYAAAIQAIRNVSSAPLADTTPSLEQRLIALELNYNRQIQKTVSGLSEDIGDLNSRLSAIERISREAEDPWLSPEFEFLSDGLKNEGADDLGVKNIVVHLEEDVDMVVKPSIVAEVKPVAEVKLSAAAAAAAAVEGALTDEEGEEEEEEEEEEEGEELELEPFTHNGTSYYRDPDNNVYTENADGEVNEAPVGRWLEKRQTIKLY